MGRYSLGVGPAFSTHMKLFDLGRQKWLPAQAGVGSASIQHTYMFKIFTFFGSPFRKTQVLILTDNVLLECHNMALLLISQSQRGASLPMLFH